jgi:CUB/sushi domain-containing protein
MDCPPLRPPRNGHFTTECSNVFSAACGVRCQSGYQLSGSALRLCLPSGTWSGEPAGCSVKSCRPMQPPNNGYVSCSTHNYEVDTICEFGCNFGYRLLGSRRRLCLPISLWGGLPAYCKPIKCPRLRKANYGDIYPPQCSTKKSGWSGDVEANISVPSFAAFGDQCAFACKKGFRLVGPSLRQCGGKGSWSGGQYMSRCVDGEHSVQPYDPLVPSGAPRHRLPRPAHRQEQEK